MGMPPGPENPYGQQPYGQQPPPPPPPGYGAPACGTPAYGQPGYDQPGYGAPGYGAPAPGYGAPGYGYGPPPEMLAGWGSRVGATFVDALVLVLVGIPMWAGYGWLFAKMEKTGEVDINGNETLEYTGGAGPIVLLVVGGLIVFAFSLWQVYKEGTTGQTIGKKAVGIRVLREADGSTLGFGMAFVRRLAHFLDSISCGIGYLWPLWDAKKQTFADKVTSTVVVKAG
jgi:uncharacterized RDD family membrane protein YckC